MAVNKETKLATSILKEELLCSSADRVFDWFKVRSEQEGRIENTLEPEVEIELLNRNEKLIELAIALYGVHSDSVRQVFKKANKQKNKPIILACLSNSVLARGSYTVDEVPEQLFENDEELVEWLKGSTNEEIETLFQNKGISTNFVNDFFEGNAYWQALDDERRITCLLALYDNPIITENYSGPMDGYAEYTHNKLFDAGWKLAETVPTTKPYAMALGLLYEKLIDKRYNYEAETVAKRWMVEVEEDSKKKWRLNDYEWIRAGIYKCIVKWGNTTKDNEQLNHSDIAYRAIAYSKFLLSEEQMIAAYDKDKLIALEYMLKNNYIWRFEHLRARLCSLSWDADEKYNSNYLDCANNYKYKEEEIKKLNPEWFVEKIDIDADQEIDEDNLQVTVGILKSHLQDYTYNQSVEILTEIFRMKQDAKNIRWWVIGCFVLLLILVVR